MDTFSIVPTYTAQELQSIWSVFCPCALVSGQIIPIGLTWLAPALISYLIFAPFNLLSLFCEWGLNLHVTLFLGIQRF